MNRPTEVVSGFAGGLALLIAFAFGLEDDPAFVWAAFATLGGLPAVVTWIVTLVRGDSAP